MLDYRVVMLADANAIWSDAEHAATLDTPDLFFGDNRRRGHRPAGSREGPQAPCGQR